MKKIMLPNDFLNMFENAYKAQYPAKLLNALMGSVKLVDALPNEPLKKGKVKHEKE